MLAGCASQHWAAVSSQLKSCPATAARWLYFPYKYSGNHSVSGGQMYISTMQMMTMNM